MAYIERPLKDIALSTSIKCHQRNGGMRQCRFRAAGSLLSPTIRIEGLIEGCPEQQRRLHCNSCWESGYSSLEEWERVIARGGQGTAPGRKEVGGKGSFWELTTYPVHAALLNYRRRKNQAVPRADRGWRWCRRSLRCCPAARLTSGRRCCAGGLMEERSCLKLEIFCGLTRGRALWGAFLEQEHGPTDHGEVDPTPPSQRPDRAHHVQNFRCQSSEKPRTGKSWTGNGAGILRKTWFQLDMYSRDETEKG